MLSGKACRHHLLIPYQTKRSQKIGQILTRDVVRSSGHTNTSATSQIPVIVPSIIAGSSISAGRDRYPIVQQKYRYNMTIRIPKQSYNQVKQGQIGLLKESESFLAIFF
jgi:hypothetical protein